MIRPALVAFALSFMTMPCAAQEDVTVSQTTADALIHVVAHELGHAFLREFDVPILGPEEDIVEDFATVYIHMMLPDSAGRIIAARAQQHMMDGAAAEMFSEYRSDDQRAGRSVCILYGLDPEAYAQLARDFGLEGEEADACADFGPEVGRSWRRVIAPYQMPDTARVTEVGLRVEDAPWPTAFADSGAIDPIYTLMSGIDWHSRVQLSIIQCDGSAGWSRNGRQITLCSSYIARFEEQLGG